MLLEPALILVILYFLFNSESSVFFSAMINVTNARKRRRTFII